MLDLALDNLYNAFDWNQKHIFVFKEAMIIAVMYAI